MLAIASILFAQEPKTVTYKEYKFEFKGSDFEKWEINDNDNTQIQYSYNSTKDTAKYNSFFELFNRNKTNIKNITITTDCGQESGSFNESLALKLMLGKDDVYYLSTTFPKIALVSNMIKELVITNKGIIYQNIGKNNAETKAIIENLNYDAAIPNIEILIREEVKE